MVTESLQLQLKDYLKKAMQFPQELHLESSSRCQSNCLMCVRDKMQRFRGEMSDDIFYKVVNEIGDNKITCFMLHLNGDPLFLPIDKLVERINYVRDKCSQIEEINFFTNGALLDDEHIDKLLASKLDKIIISVDGGCKEDYEAVRRGLNWDVLMRNLRQLVGRKRELKAKLFIQTAIVPQKLNENSVKQYYDLMAEIGVDHVAGSGVNNLGGLIDSESMKLSTQTNKWEWNDLPCWKLFLDLSIMADGRVACCSQDVTGMVILGDTKQQTIEEIWHGYMLKHIREQFIMGDRAQLPLCGACDNMRGFVSPEFWRISREQWQEAYREALGCI